MCQDANIFSKQDKCEINGKLGTQSVSMLIYSKLQNETGIPVAIILNYGLNEKHFLYGLYKRMLKLYNLPNKNKMIQ